MYRYLHCDGGAQSVVTHSGRTSSLYVISFQVSWRSRFGICHDLVLSHVRH